MDLDSSLYDWDEQVTTGLKEKSGSNNQIDLVPSFKEKKLSRTERHNSEINEFNCDWGKFPEVVKNWGHRRDQRNQLPSNDFECVKLAIVDDKYPDVLIKEEMGWTLHSAIFSLLCETPWPRAKIGISAVIAGALRVNCFGTKAVSWIKRLEGITIQGIVIKVLNVNELKVFKSDNLANDSEQELNGSYRCPLIKMAIISDNYTELPIEQHTVASIETIINEMLNMTNDPKPAIYLSKLVGSALRINCKGRNSADWLKQLGGKVVEGITLKVVNARELPQPVKMSWTTNKNLTDTAKMLKYLQRWNKKLQTNCWQIVYTSISGSYLHRIILMDALSANVIKEAKYNLFAGVEFTHFRLFENKDKKSSASKGFE